MNQLDPWVLGAVFAEMLGSWLWPAIVLAAGGALALLALLVHEKSIVGRRLAWAGCAGLFGGFLALAAAAKLSSSDFAEAGGPIDWVLIALIHVAGALVTAALVYTAAGWLRAARRQPRS